MTALLYHRVSLPFNSHSYVTPCVIIANIQISTVIAFKVLLIAYSYNEYASAKTELYLRKHDSVFTSALIYCCMPIDSKSDGAILVLSVCTIIIILLIIAELHAQTLYSSVHHLSSQCLHVFNTIYFIYNL